MTKSKPWWWFLLNWQAWVLLALGVVAAFVTQMWWVVLLGVIGHLLVLLFDLVGGGVLDRSSHVRLAQIEHENRAVSAERARLVGGIKECQAQRATLDAKNRQLMQALQEAQAEIERLKRAG